jgi:hypothetical protein
VGRSASGELEPALSRARLYVNRARRDNGSFEGGLKAKGRGRTGNRTQHPQPHRRPLQPPSLSPRNINVGFGWGALRGEHSSHRPGRGGKDRRKGQTRNREREWECGTEATLAPKRPMGGHARSRDARRRHCRTAAGIGRRGRTPCRGTTQARHGSPQRLQMVRHVRRRELPGSASWREPRRFRAQGGSSRPAPPARAEPPVSFRIPIPVRCSVFVFFASLPADVIAPPGARRCLERRPSEGAKG